MIDSFKPFESIENTAEYTSNSLPFLTSDICKIQKRIKTIPVRAVPGTFKLVKDAVVFIKGTQLAAEVIMNLEE